jgi:hypothetical protein
MSDPNILIGYISEALPMYRADPLFFRRANDAVLADLPADDAWPPLCRSLFSVTGNDSLHGSYSGQRLIYFAGHFNHLVSHLGKWLDKFEWLLRRLYWLDAEVLLMHAWSGPPVVLQYSVSKETVLQYMGDAPQPPQAWELRGFRLRNEEAVGDDLADFLGEGRVLRGPHESDCGAGFGH